MAVVNPVALVESLRAQYAEREARARKLLDNAQRTNLEVKDSKMLGRYMPGWWMWTGVEAMCGEVLADVEANRQIVDRCVEVIGDRELSNYGQPGCLADDPNALAVTLAVETLRDLASPYADTAAEAQR